MSIFVLDNYNHEAIIKISGDEFDVNQPND